MQRAVESTLRGALPLLEFRGNTKLRRGGKVLTDIDMVIRDPRSARVVLVQLKHQDPYGADFAAMLSRTERLNKQVSDWLRKVKVWLDDASTAELRATLRLPPSERRPDVSLLVLTRHYAHSLRTVSLPPDTTFANWNQLVTAAAGLKGDENGTPLVDDLLRILSELSAPAVETHLPEPPTIWTVGGLQFTVEQEGYDVHEPNPPKSG